MTQYDLLFSQVKIGTLTLKNRFAMAPMGPLGLGDAQGGFNQRGIDYYTARAKGGVGLIFTGVTFVDNEIEEHGMPNCPNSTYNPVQFVRTSREMTERVHAYNAKIFLQMSGGFGRVTIPTNLGEFPPVAPSPIQHRWLDKICRELTVEEIHTLVRRFGEGAYNAKRAGFDGVQIHAVHEGYLIDQFAISLFNHRTDEYGGSLENRLRFAREIVEEIKSRCGQDFPVVLRYSPKSFIKALREGALPGEEFEEKGRDLDEGIEAAKLLASYGYDALDVDVGSYDAWWWSHPPMYQEKGLYMPYAKLVREAVNVPVLCAGRMDDPDRALSALSDGVCDIISMGRPLLADPEYVNKLRAGRRACIRPCISCQEGCMGRIQEYSIINCAVNPQAGRERVTAYNPVLRPKRVLIAGGGPAGCEAARVLAERGHRRIGILGGNWVCSQISYRRLKGCEKTFARLGLPFDQERQCEPCRYSMGEAYAATLRLLERCPDLTAIFAVSDVMAMGTIRALRDLGKRVPEDISVVGFDGIAMANYSVPRLATVRQDTQRLAERGVDILLHNIERKNRPVHEVVPFQLIPGESVARLDGEPSSN